MTRRVLTVFALVLMLPWRGFAQEQGAALDGVVRDTQGGVLPGVVIVARSAAGLSVEGVSDTTGTYRLSALPSGSYELTASLSGFHPVRVAGIELALGVRLTVDLVFQPAGPNEVVEVVATSPSLAITQVVRATSVSGPLIDKMPHGRDFTSLALQAPGAANERKLAGISVDGASGAENRIIIDGVETTDTWVGTPGQAVITDFIDQLQVKSSGYSAEFGGSTGAVLNAVTKSGGSRWQGLGVLYWSGSALDAAPRETLRLRPDDATRAEYVTYPEDHYTQIEPGFTLGGPLVADRLWLFSGYFPSFRPLERTVTFLANQSTRTFTQDLTRQNGLVNVTASLSPRWRGKASFVTASERQHNLLPAQDGTSDPNANVGVDDVTPNHSTSASVDYTPAGWAYLSFRGGYFARDSYNEGVYQGDRFVYQTPSFGLQGVPQQYQQPRGYTNVSSNLARDRGRGPRLGIQIDGTASVRMAGAHQLKAGVQVDRLGLDALSGGTGNNILFFWGQRLGGVGGPYGYYQINSNTRLPNRGFIREGAATVTNVGLFVQDAWRIGQRLTVHAGLRSENETVPSLAPDPNIPSTAIAFSFRDKLAPRLGFAWDVTGDGRTKVYSSWGLFYDITKLQLSFGFGAVDQVVTYFALDTGDIGTIVGNPACPPTCPGALLRGAISLATPINSTVDPDVQQMRLHEFVVGVEREVGPALIVNARYIRKHVDRALEDVGTRSSPGGNYEVWVATPGQGKVAWFYPEGTSTPVALPKARRNYDAVEASLDRRARGGWAAGAAYTWSRLTGNYSGLAQSDEDGRVEPNVGVGFDYAPRSFDQEGRLVDGVLATDRPHQVKLYALADLPFHTSVGVRWFGGTGVPRTREISIAPGNPVMYLGRNSDGRLPFASQCDLHVRHVIRPGARTSVTLSLNVVNLLSQDTVNNYYPTELFTGQNVAVGEAQYLQGVDMRTLIAEQQLVRDARFLLASGFQPPRTMRVGLSISF